MGGGVEREKSTKAGKRVGSPLGHVKIKLIVPIPLSLIPLPFSLPLYPLPPNKTLQETITFTDNYYSEALWRKSNNLRNPNLAVMKSSTFHKRSKRMLLHQRVNQCRPAITAENQYACYDLSLRNKRQKSHLLSQNLTLQSN